MLQPKELTGVVKAQFLLRMQALQAKAGVPIMEEILEKMFNSDQRPRERTSYMETLCLGTCKLTTPLLCEEVPQSRLRSSNWETAMQHMINESPYESALTCTLPVVYYAVRMTQTPTPELRDSLECAVQHCTKSKSSWQRSFHVQFFLANNCSKFEEGKSPMRFVIGYKDLPFRGELETLSRCSKQEKWQLQRGVYIKEGCSWLHRCYGAINEFHEVEWNGITILSQEGHNDEVGCVTDTCIPILQHIVMLSRCT